MKEKSVIRVISSLLFIYILILADAPSSLAQFVTVGGGVLTSKRPTEPVFELHVETPPFVGARAYLTLSWTDESRKPTFISAIERPIFNLGSGFVGFGGGLLWVEPNDYNPYPMLVSSTVVPLPVPKTSFVMIASTLPFEDFDWSVVFKVGVTLFFIR